MANQLTAGRPFIGLFCLLILSACAQRGGSGADDGRFYSYVDAQGQLVTVERPLAAEDAQQEANPPVAEPADAVLPAAAWAVDAEGQGYRAAEEVEAELAERERQRFVTYVDEDGQIQRQEYDREQAREAMANRPRGWQSLDGPVAGNFVESVRAVPANCCLAVATSALELEAGREFRVSFAGQQSGTVALDEQQFPATAFALPPGASVLTVRTYARPDKPYLHPQALFLGQDRVPVLLVDNLFQRWFEPTWYHYGYLEGQVEVPEGGAWLVLFLSYAPGGQLQAPAPGTVLEYTRLDDAPLGKTGDMTVRLGDETGRNPAR